MPNEQQTLRDWHRLFGLLLTDFFTDTPFTVEIERDLSEQQQFLDVLIVRKGRGRVTIRLPDGLEKLVAHNLITFKSHHEALDAWAMKELIGHYVAYRKLVSPTSRDLLPEEDFQLFAVCARFPQGLSSEIAFQQQQAGVYDCRWGTDSVRVIVAGELSREAHNAPLHLFSASHELVDFASGSYQQRSQRGSRLLGELFTRFEQEVFTMSFTVDDYDREYFIRYFPRLPQELRRKVILSMPVEGRRELLELIPEEDRRELLKSLPVEERLADVPLEVIRNYLEKQTSKARPAARKARKKK